MGTGAVMVGHSFGLRSCGIATPWRLKTFKILYSQVQLLSTYHACMTNSTGVCHQACAPVAWRNPGG